jgi:FkbH-like protein
MQAQAPRVASLVRAAQDLLIPGARKEEIERVVAGLKRADVSVVPALKSLRVEILGSFTTDYLADHLRMMLVRAGYAASVTPGQYGGLIRGLLGEVSLAGTECDLALLLPTHRDLQYPPPVGIGIEQARELVSREVEFWSRALANCRVPSVLLSFDMPPRRVLDELDGLTPGGLGWHVRMTNLELAARLPATMSFVDSQALQARVGSELWHDERVYALCKQPFSMDALPEISQTITAALVAAMGRARKVLVLDLDNTLWGGVIGDDGLERIELGAETPEGEAFSTFQTYVKSLSQRGVVLAVCSKNRDEVARLPFREHSGMVLKEEDIACFVANFEDKASNLRRIARTLNLGLDSFVFVDDNPVERELVRKELPEVLVVELPEEPAYYARAVEAAKAFPMRHLTREDLGRAGSYRAMSAVREASEQSGTDMEQFLQSLTPTAHVEKVDSSSVDRIVQLIRKTNQFKLNVEPFNETEILEAGRNVFALRLADRLQDYGIVAIAVTRVEAGVLQVLNWVMSCRVFGRRLEHVTVELLREHARQSGCPIMTATYHATEKNVILPDILTRLGFDRDGNTYSRSVDAALREPHHMTIVDGR